MGFDDTYKAMLKFGMAYEFFFDDLGVFDRLIEGGLLTNENFFRRGGFGRDEPPCEVRMQQKLSHLGVKRVDLSLQDGWLFTFETEEQASAFVLQWGFNGRS